MEVLIIRNYFKEGTNGTLFVNSKFLCFTIELSWKDNVKNISCIPEGAYVLEPRYSKQHKHHLVLRDVKNRKLVLIHPANNAKKELRGCIAPVTQLTGIGEGWSSHHSFTKLVSSVYQAFDRKEKVLLIIKSNQNEYH
ncbi:DUF5675 family protein [Aquimarina sp. RZ0]|uniref:DUF5675 family protein n=1 Tax=Aquimarina sp. RZ0 TaxID=2607730 RepID=UPI0011F2F46C|nr:DUF5675 family protein [Aquimarina sp. RZ0]KAA1242907.1 hypothetical protein F0000_23510 [Aquimarina sp. RZ0]